MGTSIADLRMGYPVCLLCFRLRFDPDRKSPVEAEAIGTDGRLALRESLR